MVFLIYVYTDPVNHILDANKIFVSIAIFGLMRIPLTMLPWAVTEGIKLYVSLKRINKFLNADEIVDNIGDEVKDPDNILEIKNAAFRAGASEVPQLKEINLEVRSGSLVAVVGQVGSGKSLLLQSILGEMDLTNEGTINVQSKNEVKIAYVPQQAWIQNMTLKQNILFDQDFNQAQYDEVLDACALRPDLEMLTAGDNTEIGESGINLSGGQKQRISIGNEIVLYYLS